MPTIAKTIDVARRIGEGRSIGYDVPSGSVTVCMGFGLLAAVDVATPASLLSSSVGLEKKDSLGFSMEQRIVCCTPRGLAVECV